MSNKTIKNTRDYREKEVDGLLIKSAFNFKACKVTVRMTSDRIGQSLSLYAGDTMIQIPLEQVKDIIEVTKK